MRGSSFSSLKHSSLDNVGMGVDKASKLNIPPHLASCAQQNYAALGLVSQSSGEKDVKLDIEKAVAAVDAALEGLDLGSKRPSAPLPLPKRPLTQPPDLTRRSHDGRMGVSASKPTPRNLSRHSAHPAHPSASKPWESQQPMRGLSHDTIASITQQKSSSGSCHEASFLANPRASRFAMKSYDSLSSMTSMSPYGGLFSPPAYNPSGEMSRGAFGQSEPLRSTWTAPSSCLSGPLSSGWDLASVKNMLGQQANANHGIFGTKSSSHYPRGGSSKYSSNFLHASADMIHPSLHSRPTRLEPKRSAPYKGNVPSSVSNGFLPAGPALDSAMNLHLPEILKGDSGAQTKKPSWKVLPEVRSRNQNSARAKSEQALLLAIAGILKCALEGNLGQKDMKSDSNFLIVSVRKHLQDYQKISTEGAEMLLLIASTLPTVCGVANFTADVINSLKRFMEVISPGHPLLQNHASYLEGFDPRIQVQPKQRSEAQHLLTRIHRKLTGGSTSNGVQHVAMALFESSGDIRCSPGASSTTDIESRGTSPKSFAFSLLNTRTTQGSISPTQQFHGDEDEDAESASSGFSYISCFDGSKSEMIKDDIPSALDSARECNKRF